MATEETLATWLRRELRSRDWNYGDLAERAGVSRASISRWANGIELPNSENARKLADVLNASQKFVLILAGHFDREEPPSPDDPVSKIERKMRRVRMTGDRVKMIDSILETYLETDSESQESRLYHAAYAAA